MFEKNVGKYVYWDECIEKYTRENLYDNCGFEEC